MKNQWPFSMQMMCFGQNDKFSIVNTISLSGLCVAVYLEAWQAEISDISHERQSESIYWAVHHLAD